MGGQAWKVGQLAKRTGISVRTLHYYDEIGLLAPSQETESGHRLYGERDVERLVQIRALQGLGLSLEEIRGLLERAEFTPARVVELKLRQARERLEMAQRLCQRLERLEERFRLRQYVPIEELFEAMEAMEMSEKYYTPEQLKELAARGEQLGEAGMLKAQQDWQELMAAVGAEMAKGTDPASEPVRALAGRWMELVRQFSGGNPALEAGAKRMWQQEQSIQGVETGPMRQMMEYIGRAMGPR